MKEVWKNVKGYEGRYQISNLGRVKSLIAPNGKPVEKILKPGVSPQGYLFVSLCKNYKTKSFRIHRLVAQAFIPNLEDKPQVNHKNGIKSDNKVSNLEWSTPKENTKHAFENGLASNKGKRNPMYGKKGILCPNYGKKLSDSSRKKLSESRKGSNNPAARSVICITTGEIFKTIKEAEEKYKLSKGDVSKCCLGKQKTTRSLTSGKRLTWKYL